MSPSASKTVFAIDKKLLTLARLGFDFSGFSLILVVSSF